MENEKFQIERENRLKFLIDLWLLLCAWGIFFSRFLSWKPTKRNRLIPAVFFPFVLLLWVCKMNARNSSVSWKIVEKTRNNPFTFLSLLAWPSRRLKKGGGNRFSRRPTDHLRRCNHRSWRQIALAPSHIRGIYTGTG